MSERLTKRDENGNAYYDWGCLNRNHWALGRHVDRLAAYEDSGLSPEEVLELKEKYETEKSNSEATYTIMCGLTEEVERLKKCLAEYEQAKAEGRLVVLPETGIGDLSDGYHTFNELYHHRAILFSVICNEHPDISWKSKLHHDGTMFDGMFIVGINTPEGQATYHYDINPYWDMFRVRELEKAPEWDGHTSEQAIERIAGLTTDKDELVKVLKQARESLQDAWEDDGSTTVGKQILDTINAIDALLGGEKDA